MEDSYFSMDHEFLSKHHKTLSNQLTGVLGQNACPGDMQGKEVSQQPQSVLNKTGKIVFSEEKGCRWKIEWEIVQAPPTSSSTENTVPIGQWNAVAVSMRGSCGVSFRCSANISGATETEIGLLGRTLRCMVDILLWVIGPESSTFVDPWTILNIYPAKCCTWSKLVELIA